jgi:uncharacterized RDD family membrane protein YckC
MAENPYQAPNASLIESNQSAITVQSIAEKYGGSIIVLRWFGCWVDLVGCACCLLIPDWLLGNAFYQRTIVVWLVLAVAYYVVPEWLWGRTLGKLITGTVIVNESGGRPGLGQVVVRTLMRLIEVNPLLMGGIPAGIVAAISKRKQRLGDMIANTYVIRSRDLRELAAPTSS